MDFPRHPMTMPGRLLYSALQDQSKTEGVYCWWSCMACVKGQMARRTYLDIYSNGVHTNVPRGFLCCCWYDDPHFLHWDDARLTGSTFGKAGCCKPCPWCFAGGCGCCGEVVYMHQCFSCCTKACPTCAGNHECCIPCGMCALSKCQVFCGLQPGEAEKVAEQMKAAKDAADNGPGGMGMK